MSGEFVTLGLDLIASSLTNPRKTFDPTKLGELASSIKATGIHQPVLVRPLPGSRVLETSFRSEYGRQLEPRAVRPTHELVCGERRYRASRLAGVLTIPALVRDLSDSQVREIQIIENLQRDDLSAIEEAEGYESLMEHAGLTVDQVGEKIGKSRSYIYGRLKLLGLCSEARLSLRDGSLDASRALLVARIPDHKLQIKALQEIAKGDHWSDTPEPMTHRQAAGHIQRNYMLKLDTARFTITDADLVAAAGSCKTCTKRTGHDPELWSDVKSADVCTDPACFHTKEAAHSAAVIKEAEAKGQTIIAGKEALELMPEPKYHAKFKGFKRLDDVEDSPTSVPLRKLIGKQMQSEGVSAIMIEHPHVKGTVVAALPNEVVSRLLKTVEGQAQAAKAVTKEVKAFADEKKAKAAAKAQEQFEQGWRDRLIVRTWEELNSRAVNECFTTEFTMEVHRYLVVRAVGALGTDDATAICRVLDLGKIAPQSALTDHAKHCQRPDLLQLLIIMQRDSKASDHSYGDRVANEGLLLVAGMAFKGQLSKVKDEVMAKARAEFLPDPEPEPKKADVPQPSAALASGKSKVPKGESPAVRSMPARARKMSAQEATQGIAAAMQGLEGAASAADAAVAPTGQQVEVTMLFSRAVDLIVAQGKANVRMLKAGLSIGTGRALELMTELEKAGKVSACDERGIRQVLATAGDMA